MSEQGTTDQGSTEHDTTEHDTTEPHRYDVIVIGAGPPGENVAARVVRGGLSCAVVESELVGGECSYWACMPSKALLRPVELHAAARRVPGVPTGRLDPAAVLARRDEFTHDHDDASQVAWLASVPADLVRGHGRLTGPRQVTVALAGGGVRVLTATHAVVLATGTSAAVPPGFAEVGPWTSRELTAVRRIPDRLALVGGGVVAVEMAQAYAALGSRVTLLVRGSGLLPGMEPFAGALVADSLAEAGVDIRLGRQAAEVSRPAPTGPVRVRLDDGDTMEVDELAVAVGRRPRTEDLGLEVVGLPPGRYVEVDDALTVPGVDWLYAVGDVNGRNLLTHMGKYQARICGDVIVGRAADAADDGGRGGTAGGGQRGGQRGGRGDRDARAFADGLGAPQVVFTDPQAAAVGLTEAAARERGLPLLVAEYDLGQVAGASLLADGYRGRAKLVAHAQRRTVLGATFVGQDVAELVQAATFAVVGELTLDRLWHAVPAYPTVSEVWLRLLEELDL